MTHRPSPNKRGRRSSTSCPPPRAATRARSARPADPRRSGAKRKRRRVGRGAPRAARVASGARTPPPHLPPPLIPRARPRTRRSDALARVSGNKTTRRGTVPYYLNILIFRNTTARGASVRVHHHQHVESHSRAGNDASSSSGCRRRQHGACPTRRVVTSSTARQPEGPRTRVPPCTVSSRASRASRACSASRCASLPRLPRPCSFPVGLAPEETRTARFTRNARSRKLGRSPPPSRLQSLYALDDIA